ncbi:hypothetical protein BS47DRAFT_588399 [Hydnum rufescens UP504]|uniref:Zn(2)-C6 fungal-type domain-containing protein n=1 Tax=Hydnum rufescens UP504 TaxID=1448309 RepID=A0A9P6DW10_9AGAM|nr:hypothetical protein BS47DRAFT_588399 [Hydnum rufescens UP504]
MPLSLQSQRLQSQRFLPALPASSPSTPYVAQRITRSRLGCLTCRIRRKKCNEPPNQTVCDACRRLRIECLGYAPRPPEWLTPKTRDSIMKEIAWFRAADGRAENPPTLSLAKFYVPLGWAPTLAPPTAEQQSAISQPWEMSLPPASSSRGQETHFSSAHVPSYIEMSTGTIGGPVPPQGFIQSSATFFPPPGPDGTEWDEDLLSDEAWAPFDHAEYSDHSWDQS